MLLPIPADASVRLGGGGPGAFFLPNTRFIFSLLSNNQKCSSLAEAWRWELVELVEKNGDGSGLKARREKRE